ncbi:hypothetical protein MIS45_11020 [Wielerella bovis]|uniref:hypothetical protein n=1 Tax=Wielerella bovis TaxID=2917790 RepID=UPI002018DE90|nr:hypothetical protein [Wielerella bovis]ULJ69252.1 hypothetical protein MIS45_11020 [Wielerella bovis]
MNKPFVYAQISLVVAIFAELARQNPNGTLVNHHQGEVIIQAANMIIDALNHADVEQSHD